MQWRQTHFAFYYSPERAPVVLRREYGGYCPLWFYRSVCTWLIITQCDDVISLPRQTKMGSCVSRPCKCIHCGSEKGGYPHFYKAANTGKASRQFPHVTVCVMRHFGAREYCFPCVFYVIAIPLHEFKTFLIFFYSCWHKECEEDEEVVFPLSFQYVNKVMNQNRMYLHFMHFWNNS